MITRTLLKTLRLAHAALVIGLLIHPNIASAQIEISPGESIDGEFTQNGQEQHYTVQMGAGERLLVHIESEGETLFTYFEVFDPGGNQVEAGKYNKREHDLQSRKLSARGAYLIKVWNNRGVGNYTISVGKIDREGKEIPPGSKGPQDPKGSEGSRGH